MFTQCLLFFCVLFIISKGQVFRFDYEYIEQTSGWMKFHVIPSTWQDGSRRCHAEGAVLASPLTTEMRRGIISFVMKKKGNFPTMIFTGVHATFSKGDYTSIEGIPLSRLPITWAVGEPDNFNNAESCLAMDTDAKGSVSDVSCDIVLPYVCYKKFTPLIMNECGTTDHAYHLEPRTGSCYKIHSRSLVWQQAYMTCLAEGGYLVIINSKTEVDALAKMTNSSSNKWLWGAGFHDWGDRMTFLTIHGETLEKAGYNEWSANQPDNSTKERTGDKGEYCGSAHKATFTYNDVWCNVPIQFICEKSPNSLF